jgi:capsular polysaccharide transport system permease protein
MRKRHIALLFSFLLMVAFPGALTAYYLWNRAVDQYASFAGFSVQREEASTGLDIPLLGQTFGSGSTSDPEILNDFLNSQTLVAEIQDQLDVRAMWAAPYEQDPFFSFDPSGSIEDLLEHWERMVQIGYDSSTGLIELRVLAFTPEDATTLAQAILDESSEMINALSDEAREDAIRYALEELDASEKRLSDARVSVTRFRRENQIVDPTTDVEAQGGLLASLETQRAEAIIEMDILRETVPDTDPRMQQARLRIEVIEARISEERRKTGTIPGSDQNSIVDVVGEYERLFVDRQFAEQAYTAALASLELAKADARRKSRYLATHVSPTAAETSRYPQRGLLLSIVIGFATLGWAVFALTAYSLRDRR